MALQQSTDDDGVLWISHDALGYGDYGGAGSVGAANIRYLEENHASELHIDYGSHGWRQAWLRDTPENRELLRGLDNYPLLNDETHSLIEMEWEDEAWQSWLRADLLREMPDHLQEAIEDRGDLWDWYRQAMEETNTYPVCEYSGAHVDVNRISQAFRDIAEEELWQEIKDLLGHYAHGDRTDLLMAADYCVDHGRDDLAAFLRGVACEEVA